MIVVYTPSDDTRRTMDFAPDEIDVEDAELIEEYSGMSFNEFTQAAMEGRARALKVCLWLLLRGDLPTLKYKDVPKFKMGDVKIELGRAELEQLRSNLNKVPESKREAVREYVENGLAEYEGEPAPKG